MLSKNDSKLIKSLQLKKQRTISGLFITEGRKNIMELLQSDFKIKKLFLTPDFYDLEREIIANQCPNPVIVTEKDLVRSGTFRSNKAGLAIAETKTDQEFKLSGDLTIVLDNVRDPGNLGTIIRIADWYGLGSIVCSLHCTDCYNPKVINASMGSFFRVQCHYTDINAFLSNTNTPVIGTASTGTKVYDYQFPDRIILVIGNETSGINADLTKHFSALLAIPGSGNAESLNAAVATAIFCDNFMRYKY